MESPQTALPLMKDGRQARFLFLPEGEDPDTLVRKIGSQAFRDEVAHAQPLSEFFFAKLESQVDTGNIDGLARLAELAKPLLGQLPAGTFRAMMEKALEQRIGLKVDTPPPPPQEPRRSPRKGAPPQPAGMPPVRRAVALVLQHPQATATELPDGWQDLDTPGLDVLDALISRARQHPGINSAGLVEGTADAALRTYLAKLAVTELAVQEDAGEQLRGILNGLLRQAKREQREKLLADNAPSSMTEEEKQRLRELYRR